MYWKRFIAIMLCLFLSFSVFSAFSINNLSFASSQKYIIRVRVKQKQKQLKIIPSAVLDIYTSNVYEKVRVKPNNSTFILSTYKSKITLFYIQVPLKTNSKIDEVNKIREKYFIESEVSFYLNMDQSTHVLLIGPFYKKAEASFIMSNLVKNLPNCIIKTIENDTTIGLLDLSTGVYLHTVLKPQSSPFSIFILHPVEISTSICLGKYSYYGDIFTYYTSPNTLSAINHIDIETYLKGVVPAEISANWHLEALKAQAITARTFALKRSEASRKKMSSYYDVTDDTYCQVYLGTRQFDSTNKAVEETKGLVLTWNKNLITSPFHSCSGGETESNANAWGSTQYPYLKPVLSPGEEISPHFSWYKYFTFKEFEEKVKAFLYEKKSISINSLLKWNLSIFPNSSRIDKIYFSTDKGEISTTGYQFQCFFGLKSNWFGIYKTLDNTAFLAPPLLNSKVQQNKNSLIFIYGKGWGHGVGLSQYGAAAAAMRGESFSIIATRYYRDSEISAIDFINSPKYSSQKSTNSEEAFPFIRLAKTKYETYASGVAKLSFFLSEKPEAKQIELGQNPRASLKIETHDDLFGITFHLYFPTAIIEIDEKTFKIEEFLKTNNVHVNSIIKKEYTEDGIPYLNIALSRVEKENGGVSGQGILLSFQIDTKSVGTGSIHIDNCVALDSKLSEIKTEILPFHFSVFTIDRDPPTTVISSHPDRYTNQKAVQFRWTGKDIQTKTKDLLFSFHINSEPWSPFTHETSKVFYLKKDGDYTFSVRAKDSFGNIDNNPPTYIFTLDTLSPILEVDPIPSTTANTQITINGKSEFGCRLLVNGIQQQIEANGTFSFSINLKLGINNIHISSSDQTGNISAIEYSITREIFTPIFIRLQIGSLNAFVKNKSVLLDSAPFTEKGRTMVPLRFIAESFGAKVDWSEIEQKITIFLSVPYSRKIELWLNKKTVLVDGKKHEMDVAPFTIPPGRSVVPLRFIAESFGAKVDWFPNTQSIEILFPKATNSLRAYYLQNWFQNHFQNVLHLFDGRD
ncbi:MAG: SpoIID/LytB domain-containing protein [Caldisericia bacterium]|nr:SpoIID/LytB domain-containing protein [Caldisericia bacterium]